MKNKPHSHRTSNTFKFKGFQEKLKSIRINSKKFILKKLQLEDETETFLWHTILSLKDDNLTLGFQEFQSAIGKDIQTVAQLVLNEGHVSEVFRRFLKSPDVLYLQPILISLVAFARDIESIFYEKYFYGFVQDLISIISVNRKCHETIENVFVCFVSLFTMLQKYVRNDFKLLYVKNNYGSLFSKQYPWYINELAAQSLGHLLRHTPNRDKLQLCLKRVTKHEDEIEGVGRLLFHVLKSEVVRRLHSSSSLTLSTILDLLIKESEIEDQALEAVLACIKHLTLHVTSKSNVSTPWQETWKEDSKHIFPIIFSKFEFALKSGSLKEKGVKTILSLIKEFVEFKHSLLLTNFDDVINLLTSSLTIDNVDDIGNLIADIISILLNSSHYNGSQSVFSNFVNNYFKAAVSPSVIFYFIDQTVTLNKFEEDILPLYLEYILSLFVSNNDQNLAKEVMRSFVNIIYHNVGPVRSMDDIELWSKYKMDFSPFLEENFSLENMPSKHLDAIISEGLLSDNSNMEDIVLSCICLPHFCPLEKEEFVPSLFWIMNDAFSKIQKECKPLIPEDTVERPQKKKKKTRVSDVHDMSFNIKLESDEISRKLIFLVSIVIETLHHLISEEEFMAALSGMELLTILRENNHYRDNIHLLKAIDIHLSVLARAGDGTVITEDTLVELYPYLAPSLSSHKPLVRLLVSHIFSLFPYKGTLIQVSQEEKQNIFSIMYEVESMSISPLEFKERIRLLSQLDIDNDNLNRPVLKMFDVAPLLFFIGQLYINFKEIWSPIIDLISKYAYHLPDENFWPVWSSQIKNASHFAMRTLCNKRIHGEAFTSFDEPLLAKLHSDIITHPGYTHLSSKSDYLNFRSLLWQAMQQFPDICERHHKDVVTEFFNFLYNEFFPIDVNVAPTQDISLHAEINEEQEDNEEKEEENDGDQSEDINNSSVVSTEEDLIDPNQRVRKAPTKALCEHLALFAKFHNPKIIHKSKELENIYCEFLSHPYMKAQKLALDAVMTYNHKYLTPYKETLYNILDDDTFRNEITVFDIDGRNEDQSKSLREDHRSDFMPFLMRILYGKMLYKTGSHTAGRSKIAARKAIILRFLAGANETELQTFLNLSFDFMFHHLEGSVLDIVEKSQRINPKEVVPLKRMQGALGTLETIFSKIGSLVIFKRQMMLKVIIFVLTTSITLLEKKSEVCSHFFPLLKSLRQTGMQRLLFFFNSYKDYRWSNYELEAVFRSAVWPGLDRLPYEGIYSPTPLLRLFNFWAINPPYQILLSRHYPDDPNITPMPYIIKLVNHPKCSSSVRDFVYNFIEMLLKSPAELEEDCDNESNEIKRLEPFDLPLENMLPLVEKAEKLGLKNLTCGELIVFSCMDTILGSIKNSLVNLGNGQMISKRELTILISIGQWITEKSDAKSLIEVILPLLKKNCVKQNDIVSLLFRICTRLLDIIDDSAEYARDLLCLLSVIDDRNCRQYLCKVIQSGYTKSNKIDTISKWCSELNSYRSDAVDEIDAETRLNCLKEVNGYIKSATEFEEEVILFLIHQNSWVIRQAGDQALSNLSTQCLENLIDMLVQFHSDAHLSVNKLITQWLSLLKSGLKNKNENSRIFTIRVLCKLIHECRNFHPRLKDLYTIANTEDMEADFYANMAHLQWSRRTKAFLRLSATLNEGKIHLKRDTILEFILPMASVYLFKEEYAKDGNLLTSCVICIGALAKQLPWSPYLNLLKHYLNLLSRELNQLKLAVRILEVVIDSFHEDLSVLDDFGTSAKNEIKIQTKIEEKCDERDTEEGNEEEEEEDDEVGCNNIKNVSKARKVYWTLTRDIIPQIQRTFGKKSTRDSEHKVNKKKHPEGDEIKKIPLALALIKLLKKLPKKLLEDNANSVLMKLINLLKSKSEVIRREARNMLVKVMEEIGGKYLTCLVNDMISILTTGYQSHVMVYTLHAVLMNLEKVLVPSDIIPCVSEIMTVCIEDIFGDKAEEKEVTKITAKVREAKSEKGYSTMRIIAQNISVDGLNLIIVPLKQKLQTHDKKVVNKVGICLQKIGSGLEENGYITVEHKSIFIYTLLKEKVDELTNSVTGSSKTQTKPKEKRPIRQDSFLIEPEPRKVGLEPKVLKKSTSHVLIEFGLNLLFSLLKSGKFSPEVKEHISLLDSYVGIMNKFILSEYPEVSIQALNAITYLVKFPVPSLKENLPNIWGKMFVILNKFATLELTNGKLFQLVQLDFKVMSIIIKSVSIFKLDMEHAKSLIYYARNNLEDYNRHHSSFIILNALIERKVNVLEMHELMNTIKEMSILSTNISVIDQSRRIFLNYMLSYSKKMKQLNELLLFFVRNLSYEIPEGRMSALLAVNELVTKLPSKLFDQELEYILWHKVTQQLAKESNEHKLMLQKIMRTLFLKSCRKNVFIENCMKLLQDNILKSKIENALSIHMGCQSLLAMLDIPVEEHPSSVCGEVLPKVISLLCLSRYQNTEDLDEEEEDTETQCFDMCLNSVFDLLLKLATYYMTKNNFSKWNNCVSYEFWNNVLDFMMYPNLKVRLSSVSCIGKFFAMYPIDQVDSPVIVSTTDRAKNLISILCNQLKTECSVESPLLNELGLEIVRNLVYVIQNGKKVPIKPAVSLSSKFNSEGVDDEILTSMENTDSTKNLYLEGAYYVLQKVGSLAYEELRIKGKHSTFRRECLLNLIAALVVLLNEDMVKAPFIVSYIVTHLTRELSDKNLPEKLVTLTNQVSEFIQKSIGIERYNEETIHAQTKMEKRKNEVKSKVQERLVTNPEIAMNKKAKKRVADKESKKRKFAELKLKPNKKRKLRNMAIVLG